MGIRRRLTLRWVLSVLALTSVGLPVRGADAPPEYGLKAAILYNFALYTSWPDEVGGTLNLCIYGSDPFGKEIDFLQGKAVGDRHIAVLRKTAVDSLNGCQIVFVASSAIDNLLRVLEAAHAIPMLTVADSPGAASQGVALNMTVTRNKVTFEANLSAARDAGLNLSSMLLRLATRVIQ